MIGDWRLECDCGEVVSKGKDAYLMRYGTCMTRSDGSEARNFCAFVYSFPRVGGSLVDISGCRVPFAVAKNKKSQIGA